MLSKLTRRVLRTLAPQSTTPLNYRFLSISPPNHSSYSCKLLVVGGGSGGCTIAAKFTRLLPKDSVIVLEPSQSHYYQPLYTLVGAGITPLETCLRPASSVLPSNAKWIQDKAKCVKPRDNQVETEAGHVINYEYIVIAVGIQNDYERIPGLANALSMKDSGVSTIYSPEYCTKTWSDLQKFKGGDAIFTYPQGLIKCPGAPQKIAYLADSYLNKINLRSKSKISFNTALPVIFGVKKYADALLKVVEKKDINVNYKTVLKAVRPDKKEADFCKVDDANQVTTASYNLLHVTPPMKTPAFLRSADISNNDGYLTVDKYTLQHVKYPNIYGIGDCTDTPNSKTAAAIAKQCYVLKHNLIATMKSDNPKEKYDGYGACPLVTSYNTCILAEFLYDGVVHETLPINQAQERHVSYYMKRYLFPFIYWNYMLKGHYHGPEFVRKIINPLAK